MRTALHDNNAGGRCEARRLLMLTRYGRLGASSRQRFFLLSEPLRRAGFMVETHALLSNEYLQGIYDGRPISCLKVAGRYASRILALSLSRRSDVIWVEKEALPWMPAWVEHLLIGGRTLIIDFDDAWHLKYECNDVWYARLAMRKLEVIARRADVVLAANRELWRWAHSVRAKDVHLVPTVVDVDRYKVADEPDGPFTIGWIGTPLNLPYLKSIIEPLRRLSAQGARLLLIGAPPSFRLPGVTVEPVPWTEATETAQISRCHVGIMPLDDTPWDRCKSGYKLIQYMAAGRAVVASPIGANRDIVDHGVTGFLAGSGQGWLDALTALRDDPAMRRRLGLAGRERCEALFSMNVAVEKIISALSDRPEFAGLLQDSRGTPPVRGWLDVRLSQARQQRQAKSEACDAYS